jgi:hypothetical protein
VAFSTAGGLPASRKRKKGLPSETMAGLFAISYGWLFRQRDINDLQTDRPP